MQNDFEKQVQQKMEELNFVPSDPVWTNIEKEIRKKGKRSIFIWLPLLLLLAGGGLYWNYSVKKSINNVSEQFNLSKTNAPSNHTNPTIKENDKISNGDERKNNFTTSLIINSNKFKINTIQRTHLNKSIFKNEQRSGRNSLEGKKSVLIDKANIKYVSINDITPKDDNSSSLIESKIKDRSAMEHLFKDPQFNLLFDAVEQKIVKLENERKVVVHQNHYWVLGMEASIGISNQNSGKGSMDKSYAMSFPGAFPQSAMVQSPYTRSLSYSAGITLRRKLSKSIEFETGLTYQYLSFNVLVGQYVKQDTVVNMYALNQYYRNTSYSLSQSWTLSNYKNQLHLISVPFKVSYQPFGKLPVKLTAGILLQQLIHSNMLIYDVNSGVYYSSDKSLNKWLVASTAGIDYSFPFLKHTFSMGPYINYGLSNTIKDKAGYLHNINLRTSVDLKKLNAKQRF